MISLVIPTFNEEKRLPQSLQKLKQFLADFDREIEVILVDDASTDKTFEVAEKFSKEFNNFRILRLPKNLGKGWAVKNGILSAKGGIAIFTDADFSTPIEEINKLIKKIESGADVAIGSRALDRSLVKKHQNPMRELMGRCFNILVQILAVRGISDTQCGFKAFKLTNTRDLFEKQEIYDFGFDVEILFLARKKGLKIAEVPVTWFNDPSSKVDPVKDSLLMIYDLFKIRLLHSGNKKSLFDRALYPLYKKKTFTKFALVGFTGTLVDYISYIVLTRFFDLSPLKANPISVELAILWTFTFNNLWTFSKRHNEKSLKRKFLTFQLVSLGGLMLSQIQILIYTHYTPINDLFVKALTIPVVAFFNYMVNNRWTFRDSTKNSRFTFLYILLILSLFVIYLVLVREVTGAFNLFVR